MTITNEQAMRELATTKARSTSSGALDTYWYGVLLGAAGAYMMAGVITLDQYTQLTVMEQEPA